MKYSREESFAALPAKRSSALPPFFAIHGEGGTAAATETSLNTTNLLPE